MAILNWGKGDRNARSVMGAGVAAVMVLSAYSMSDAGWTTAPLGALGWLILGCISSPLLSRNLNSKVTKGKSKTLEVRP